jgi:hypothetical protein
MAPCNWAAVVIVDEAGAGVAEHTGSGMAGLDHTGMAEYTGTAEHSGTAERTGTAENTGMAENTGTGERTGVVDTESVHPGAVHTGMACAGATHIGIANDAVVVAAAAAAGEAGGCMRIQLHLQWMAVAQLHGPSDL